MFFIFLLKKDISSNLKKDIFPFEKTVLKEQNDKLTNLFLQQIRAFVTKRFDETILIH